MHAFPHRYRVSAAAHPEGEVQLTGEGLPPLASAAPREFDGPGDRWSPETLLCAALADCFVLTFRALARAARLDWTAIECAVEGKLERPVKESLFTEFRVHATLTVPGGSDSARAQQLLEKAERSCLISNSLSATRHLEASVTVR